MLAPFWAERYHVPTTVRLSSVISIAVPICDIPSPINRWCRCVLSPINGDVPRNMRAIITRRVSKTGIESIANTKGTRAILLYCAICAYSGLQITSITNTDNTKPSCSEPPSPTNILDSMPKALCSKNGITEPATATASAKS